MRPRPRNVLPISQKAPIRRRRRVGLHLALLVVFLFNLLALPVFLLLSYRFAKSLAGETFAIVASLLVAAHPMTLISVRSGGFDFLAVVFALLVIKSFSDFTREAREDVADITLANCPPQVGLVGDQRFDGLAFAHEWIGNVVDERRAGDLNLDRSCEDA